MNIRQLNEALNKCLEDFKMDQWEIELLQCPEELTDEDVENALRKQNPTIFFNNAQGYHYFMDFSFEVNGKKYWCESKRIAGDFTKMELIISEQEPAVKNESSDKKVELVADKRLDQAEFVMKRRQKGRPETQADIEAMNKFLKNSDLLDRRDARLGRVNPRKVKAAFRRAGKLDDMEKYAAEWDAKQQ